MRLHLVLRVERVCVSGGLLQRGVVEGARRGVEQLKPHLLGGGDSAHRLRPQGAHVQLQGKVGAAPGDRRQPM